MNGLADGFGPLGPAERNGAQPGHPREAGLGYRDVAKMAREATARGLRFAGAETVEPGSSYWVLRLRAADGTLYSVDSWAGWRNLLREGEETGAQPQASGLD